MSRATVELENFSERETAGLVDELLVRLQCIRYLAATPIYISSGLRPDDMDDEIEPHEVGEAADIADNMMGQPISSRWRHRILKAAYAVGFERVGIYDRHLHLDVNDTRDQEVSWIGVSQ